MMIFGSEKQVYKSIADDQVLSHFKENVGINLFNNSQNTCSIENVISVSSMLWPEIVEVGPYIFISYFYNGNIENLESKFNDRIKIEKMVNSFSLSEFFLHAFDESVLNETIFFEFCKVIKFFWELRFKTLFPERDIVVEIGENIMGEMGWTIVVYQR